MGELEILVERLYLYSGYLFLAIGAGKLLLEFLKPKPASKPAPANAKDVQ